MRYQYRRGSLTVVSDTPIDSEKYVRIDDLPDPEPTSLEPTETEAEMITHAGGGYYDVDKGNGITVRVFGKPAALLEARSK